MSPPSPCIWGHNCHGTARRSTSGSRFPENLGQVDPRRVTLRLRPPAPRPSQGRGEDQGHSALRWFCSNLSLMKISGPKPCPESLDGSRWGHLERGWRSFLFFFSLFENSTVSLVHRVIYIPSAQLWRGQGREALFFFRGLWPLWPPAPKTGLKTPHMCFGTTVSPPGSKEWVTVQPQGAWVLSLGSLQHPWESSSAACDFFGHLMCGSCSGLTQHGGRWHVLTCRSSSWQGRPRVFCEWFLETFPGLSQSSPRSLPTLNFQAGPRGTASLRRWLRSHHRRKMHIWETMSFSLWGQVWLRAAARPWLGPACVLELPVSRAGLLTLTALPACPQARRGLSQAAEWRRGPGGWVW